MRRFELPRPLDRLASIKVKLGVVCAGSVTATVAAIVLAVRLGLLARYAFLAGLVVSLVAIQLLAHGMVAPLREMAAAASRLAAGDRPGEVRATAHDEVGELARAFNVMSAALDDLERQRRDLVANVSHELRTPVAALRARLENAVDGVEPLDAHALEVMLRSTERLSRLVDALLDLSQLESGGARLERARLDVAELVAGAVAEVAPRRADVRLDVRVDAGLAVSGDADALHRVLVNLLDNAVRHSPSHGTVTVEATSAGDGTSLVVADEGPGIERASASLVFERFSRLDASRSAASGGAGLGLAIARSIVELHGGTISVGPPAGRGARLLVTLPS
jgi:signal transduction histidine kinase